FRSLLFFFRICTVPGPTLFPYTTLFRSGRVRAGHKPPALPDLHPGRGELHHPPAGRAATAAAPYDVSRATPLAAHASRPATPHPDRKSTRLNSSHVKISYAVFCLKKKNK